MVIAEHRQMPHDRDARSVARHQDHRLLLMLGRVRIGLAHEDHDLAARVAGAGSPPFTAVDDVFVAVAVDRALDVGCVARRHRRLRHAEGGADLAVEQRLQPFLLMRLCPVALYCLHIAGIRRRAVEYLAGPQDPAHHLAKRRVFDVVEPRATMRIRQEQVPQPDGARLDLELFEDRRNLPAAFAFLQLLMIEMLVRIDMLVHEGVQPGEIILGLLAVLEIHPAPHALIMIRRSRTIRLRPCRRRCTSTRRRI